MNDQIIINQKHKTRGAVSAVRRKVSENGTDRIIVTGIMKLQEYIEDVSSISTAELFIDGVDVVSEAFGSQESDVAYEFSAHRLAVKVGGEWNG